MAKLTSLEDAKNAVTAGKTAQVTVRSLLGWFGAERRGSRVVDQIERALEKHGLTTEPAFDTAHIDETLTFHAVPQPEVPSQQPRAVSPHTWTAGLPTVAVALAFPTRKTFGHAHRVRSVPSARKDLEKVPQDMPIAKALSILVGRNLHQLAVVSGTNRLRGVFSFTTHGAAIALGRQPVLVQDAMEAARTLSPDADLFEAARDVATHGAAFVVGEMGPVGIVTADDIARYLAELAEPFAMVGEVEGHLRTMRRRVDGATNGGDDETLAEQHGWFASNWERLGLHFDREYFLRELDEIRQIRNDLAHFSADPIAPAQLDRLRRFARLLARMTDG